MNIIHLKCQNCSADLDIDMEHFIAFCPYCGQKLLFDVDQIGNILLEKEKTNHEKERTKQQELKYEHDLKIKNMNRDVLKGINKWYWKSIRYSIYFVLGMLAFLFILLLLDKLFHISG